MPRLLKPRALGPGAVLGIAAPGGPVEAAAVDAGCAVLEAAGFATRRRDDLLAREGYLAGNDARRAAELMQWVCDERIDGIVCARGGYGSPRILGALDADAVRAARKPLVGYSDVTALLLWQRRAAGLVGFHGPMLERGADVDADAWNDLALQLRGEGPAEHTLRGTGRRPGSAKGRLTGGNLAMVTASLGTPWEVDTRGAILLLEEVNERPYAIDRMLQQLAAAGKLAGLAGVGLGDLSACEDPRYPEPDAERVVEEVLTPLGIPLVGGLPFGHVKANLAWPLGVRATIDGDRGEIRILERGVSRAT